MAKGNHHSPAALWRVTAGSWLRRRGLIAVHPNQNCRPIYPKTSLTTELGPRARQVYWLLLLAAFSLPGAVALAGAAQPGDSQGRVAASVPPLQVVSGSETQATVVFVTRIINGAKAPLRSPRIHLHAPVNLPHQDIAELDVEGNPERLADRWGAPVLLYQREELAPGTSLVGRWSAWATVRRFQWDLKTNAGTAGVAALSPEERTMYLRDGKELLLDDPVIRDGRRRGGSGKERTGGGHGRDLRPGHGPSELRPRRQVATGPRGAGQRQGKLQRVHLLLHRALSQEWHSRPATSAGL